MLRPGGRFVAFDPNRMNPFMWLYRDRASPFYSSVGVTENERPVLAERGSGDLPGRGFHGGNRLSVEPSLPLRRFRPCALAAAAL